MAREFHYQLRLTEDEKVQFESVARMIGVSVAEYLREHIAGVFMHTDWHQVGLEHGQGGIFRPPPGDPTDPHWTQYMRGWNDGYEEESEDEFVVEKGEPE